jgi:XisH protein
MSAKDIFHEAVKRGLVKDGWTIAADPLELEWEGVTVKIDLAADFPGGKATPTVNLCRSRR